MIAIEIRQPGDPDVLVPVERPRPEPGSGEVLIKVAAAGVNRPDVMQRQGRYPPPPGAPDIPGLEVAGTIAAIGPDVSGWRQGETISALSLPRTHLGTMTFSVCTFSRPSRFISPTAHSMARSS